MENSEIQAPSYTMHRTQTKNIDYRDTGTIVHNAQNTNQEWRIQRYRQHRTQYTEHEPRMRNPEIQATSCTSY